jgi:hypothetical protein
MSTRTEPVIIFGGIDGTSPRWNDDEYRKVFEYSFISVLCNSWSYGPRHYERGPTTFDQKPENYTVLSALRIFEHVQSNWKPGETAVFLAGYSRGGAAVIEVAKWLKSVYIPVECLILYDPVDRTGLLGLPWQDTPIVDTVKTVIYAKRSPLAQSRESFGNCGLMMWNGQSTQQAFPNTFKEFLATHGGLGGVPWTVPKEGVINEGPPDGETTITVTMDRIGANQVQQWSFNLIDETLDACRNRLNPYPPWERPDQRPKIHIVQPGDWLSKIAIIYYGDANKWLVIYDYPKNRQTIGPDPNRIVPGQRLVIPCVMGP